MWIRSSHTSASGADVDSTLTAEPTTVHQHGCRELKADTGGQWKADRKCIEPNSHCHLVDKHQKGGRVKLFKSLTWEAVSAYTHSISSGQYDVEIDLMGISQLAWHKDLKQKVVVVTSQQLHSSITCCVLSILSAQSIQWEGLGHFFGTYSSFMLCKD